MKTLLKSLATTFSLLILLSVSVGPVSANGWVDHRFFLKLPDGSVDKIDLKGAKIHQLHNHSDDEINDCGYPDKDDFERIVGRNKDISSGYHCATFATCSVETYLAPYLPKDFNSDKSVYSKDNASYAAFHDGKQFSKVLAELTPYSHLNFQNNNIRGFEGAKWKASFQHKEAEDGTMAKATKNEIDRLDGEENWGKVAGYSDKQRWSEGEVIKDNLGGNALHGQIEWILEAPSAPPPPPEIQKPTASLAGKCANSNPGIPSYTYTLSNIDLKGGTFKSSHLHLNVTKGAWTNEFKQTFGPPIYESTDANGVISYSLIFTTAAPTNNTITWNVLPTEGVGNQASNTKTVADLVRWVDAKKAAGVTIPFEIKTTLEAEKDGATVLNDSISVASNGFKPKFVTDECGQPTGGGGAPVCADIRLLDFGGNPTSGDKLKAGDKVEFSCGQVTGATAYKFRVLELNSAGKIGKTIDLPPYPGRISTAYTIPQAGTFMAQCAICTGPGGTGCQAFEDTGLSSGTPDPVTPPAPGSGGACPYACVTNGGCNTSLGWKVESQYTCGTNQVCCNLK